MITNSIKTVESQTEESNDEQVFVFRFWQLLNTTATPFTWNFPVGDDYVNFVGRASRNAYLQNILNTVGASLYQKYEPDSGPNHDFIPQLAIDLPAISDNGLTYTVTLKEGLKFSNGNPLTAKDVVFSYNLYLSPSISQQNYYDLVGVIGTNSSITALDDLTIEFKFLDDSIFNFEVLTGFPIIESKSKYIEKLNNCNTGNLTACIFDFSRDDVFTSAGPFMIDSHDVANHEFQLVKNPYYHDKMVWADRLILQGKRGGDFLVGFNATEVAEDEVADIIGMPFNPRLLEEWEQPHPYTLFGFPHSDILQITLNFLHPIFGTGEGIPFGPLAESDNNEIQARHVRKAFSYLMDREYASNDIWGGAGLPTSSLIPWTAAGYNASQEVHEFSLDLAKSHLEKAGFDYSNIVDSNGDGDYDDINDTHFFNFTNMVFLEPQRPDRKLFIDYTASQFAKVGIGLQVKPDNLSRYFDWEYYFEEQKLIPTYDDGGFDTVIWVYQYNQPFTTRHGYTSKGFCNVNDPVLACNNWGGYQNSVIDSLTNQFEDTGNWTSRTNLLSQIQTKLTEELPAIPISFGESPVPKKINVTMPDGKYMDSGQLLWEFARKDGWVDPTKETNDEDGLDLSSQNVVIIIAVVVVVGVGSSILIRRR
jgi:ABC-type transport system substrate-binding protein